MTDEQPSHPGFLHHAWTVWCWFVTWHARWSASPKEIYKNPDVVFYIMAFIALLLTATLIKRHFWAWKANRVL